MKTIKSYKVTGLTQNCINHPDGWGDTVSSRVTEMVYIIDSDKTGAKEQFLKLYPGSSKIRVELIKELFRVDG